MRRGIKALPLVIVLALLGPRAARAADTIPPVIYHTPVTTAVRGDSVPITARIEDESGIFGATLWYRPAGTKTYVSLELVHSGNLWGASIPANSDIEYWLEAYDEFGNGPSRSGSPDKPYLIKVADRPPPTEAQQDQTAQPPDKAGTSATSGTSNGSAGAGTAAGDMALGTTSSTSPAGDSGTAKTSGQPDEDSWIGNLDVVKKPAGSEGNALGPEVTTPGPPVYRQWWFITGVSVVGAAAIGTAIYFLLPQPINRNVFNATVRAP